jgi:SAM-dependent methyltransferase
VSDAEARMQVQDKYDVIEEQFNRELDESLRPSGPDSLFGYVAEMGLPPGAVAVDAGCGEGEHAVELATRFGFRVTGVDPVLRLVEAARRNAPPGYPVTFAAGTAEQNYDIKLGDCRWHIYRMIGKLSSRIYLLSAPGEPPGRLPARRVRSSSHPGCPTATHGRVTMSADLAKVAPRGCR